MRPRRYVDYQARCPIGCRCDDILIIVAFILVPFQLVLPRGGVREQGKRQPGQSWWLFFLFLFFSFFSFFAPSPLAQSIRDSSNFDLWQGIQSTLRTAARGFSKITYPCRTGTDGACRSIMELQGPDSFGADAPASPALPAMDGSEWIRSAARPARANPELAMARGEVSGRTELAPAWPFSPSFLENHLSGDSGRGDGPQTFAADGRQPMWAHQRYPSH
ncbi:hypothetical protein B0I35DRAFT_27015 [Stachybotrys elegans]|uniref:Uncharacterized protein n=1 Tax=Stachybotrys elegans TaxID=80388 RepID=A0A8K0WX24_9HYPO|nr:hypothetical protein B0I35DRAFT_27015 [Stachybotrys elegans]